MLKPYKPISTSIYYKNNIAYEAVAKDGVYTVFLNKTQDVYFIVTNIDDTEVTVCASCLLCPKVLKWPVHRSCTNCYVMVCQYCVIDTATLDQTCMPPPDFRLTLYVCRTCKHEITQSFFS